MKFGASIGIKVTLGQGIHGDIANLVVFATGECRGAGEPVDVDSGQDEDLDED